MDRLGVVVLVVATIATFAIVPGGEWTAFAKPTTWALHGILLSLVLLTFTRLRRALLLERVVFALFLATMPFIYVAGSLTTGSGTLPVELVGIPIYVALAIVGMKRPILLAVGIVL